MSVFLDTARCGRRAGRRRGRRREPLSTLLATLALYFVWYNWCRRHKTARLTPAQVVALTDTWHDVEWIVGLIDAAMPTPKKRAEGSAVEVEARGDDSMRAYLLLALALFASGCADPPTAAPTPIPPADPEPSAVSVEIDQTTARVGEIITITYRLAPPLDRSVDIWTEVNPPTGETRENGPIDFPAGQATVVFNTGYIPESCCGGR